MFEQLLATLNEWVAWLDGIVWSEYLLIPLLLLAGLYLTFLLRGIQFHRLGYALWVALFKRKEGGADGDISHYQALSMALAATVGVGNIAGVGLAVGIGGPGALFWMWMTGLVGMATKYSEAFLGVRFRTKSAIGRQAGGPMYYLNHIKFKKLGAVLAVMFAVFGLLASFGIGNMSQSNAVASAASDEWGVAPWVTGLVITVLAAAVIIGGVKVIGQVASAFVPLMIVVYILGACWVLAANAEAIPGAFGLIFSEAFTGSAGAGGAAGSALFIAIQQGVARGIFSNESGLGTGGIAAAAAKTTQPVRQALVSMTQTFIDTLVVVTFTGLVVVVSGAYKLVTPGDYDTDLAGEALTRRAFSDGLPGDWGGIIVGLGLVFFAFTTLLGWSYYGERCLERLTGGRVPLYVYKFVFIALIFVGTVANLEHVITFSDLMNGLMALPNLVGLILLSGLVYRETRDFFRRPDWKLMEPVERVSA